jgi:hypothetical protein
MPLCVQPSKKKGRGVKLLLGGGMSVAEQRRQQALQLQVRPQESAACNLQCCVLLVVLMLLARAHCACIHIHHKLWVLILERVCYACRLSLRATMGGRSARR